MEISHSVSIRVFCSQEENEAEIVNGLKQLLPFDVEKEKITLQRQKALGFNDRKISILEVVLTKNKHVKAFLDNVLQKISATDKQMLLRQLDSRIDDEANLFIRFDKQSLAGQNNLLITDTGNCYHVKIKIAAYPSTKEKAVEVVKRFLTGP